MLSFHFIDSFLKLFMLVLDYFDILGDYHLLTVHSVLVLLVEVALLPELLPG